jgi:hypothetical protein
MGFYNILVAVHVLCAGVWITTGIATPITKKLLASDNNSNKNMILCFLKYTNIAGIIGSMGLLLTGITIVLMNDAYGFFRFSSDHWLVTKQLIMIVILFMVFFKIIPTAKNVRTALSADGTEEVFSSLAKLSSTTQIVFILVVINILMALSKNFM